MKKIIFFVFLCLFLFFSFYPEFTFDLSSLKGKRVIICGASMGLGEELAYTYSRAGANIVIIARRNSTLMQAAAKAKTLGVSV